MMNFFIELVDIWQGYTYNETESSTSNLPRNEGKLSNRHVMVMDRAQRAVDLQIPVSYLGAVVHLKQDVKTNIHLCGKYSGSYGIHTLGLLMKNYKLPCFRSYLEQFDTIIADNWMHDSLFGNKQGLYPPQLEKFLISLNSSEVKNKFLWVGPRHSNVKYLTPKTVAQVESVVHQQNISYVDFYSLTYHCTTMWTNWTNCTCSDGHSSRMVHRSLVLHVLDMMRAREVA